MATHASLTGASLHEPKGVATATVGTVYKADGAGSGSWTTVDYRSVPAGYAIGHGYTQSATAVSTTSTIDIDDTIPQNTEGAEVITLTYTPQESDSILKIEVSLQVGGGSSSAIVAALFVDSTASALMARATYVGSGSTIDWANQSLNFVHYVVAGTTASRTYKVRIGTSDGNTAYSSRNANGGLFGNVDYSTISLTEIKV